MTVHEAFSKWISTLLYDPKTLEHDLVEAAFLAAWTQALGEAANIAADVMSDWDYEERWENVVNAIRAAALRPGEGPGK